MDLEQARLEGKNLFTDGTTVGEWFSAMESKFGCHKTHLILALAPFEHVALSQHTMRLYGNEIMLSLTAKLASGDCVLTQDRYFFFTDSTDAVVFKLIWHHKEKQ